MNKINPKELIDLILEIGKLKEILRTGWVKKGIKNSESVADHSYGVAILAMLLSPQLKINVNKTIEMALIHDLGEIKIGDIIWEKGKLVVGLQKDKHQNEEDAIKELFLENPSFNEYIDLWKEFESQQTPESKAVKLFDKLDMLIQAYSYEKRKLNRESLQEFWDNVEKYLKGSALENYLEELKKLRKNK